jgi:hypothetical protein
MKAEVVKLAPKALHPGDLMRVIRKLAEQGAVSFSYHAFDERGTERDIDMDDALAVLRQGMIRGEITPGTNPGEWKCKVVDKPDDWHREIGVVAVVVKNQRILIITVEWEDK